MKILLVEENLSLSESIERHLESKGHNVIRSNLCKNAVQLLDKTKFDVVITTIGTLDCIEYCVIDALEKNGMIHETDVLVLLTNEISKDEKMILKNRGVDFCFSMPVTPEVLVEAIDSLSQ